MALPDDRAPGPGEQLRALTDRAELTGLVNRFVIGLDHPDAQRCGERWYRSLFTEDVRLALPNGTHEGIVGLPEFQSGPRRHFARTHHLATNCLIELDGVRATARTNVRATHVPHGDGTAPNFVGGAAYDVEAVRTPDGWRISRLTVTVLWTSGRPTPGSEPGIEGPLRVALPVQDDEETPCP
ncbi:nuclear transport factor 2 family protein [Streptomyces regalis]|uniref:SnoaL-like domain-containing protein n=1 Tax=Streptomyces regalis TaxID=68262 RepID=A0A124GA53_9ACTN|nr:nuclear transport factor 2 family protein [Streptomyces regalis]KUL31166.1 hypothetical protein ADL12_25665 [Streptomyces regalis]